MDKQRKFNHKGLTPQVGISPYFLSSINNFPGQQCKLNYNTTEHVFIQAYIACQILLLSIIVLPFNGYAKVDNLYELPLWLIFVLFCWDYKQLYRCTWWRSFWRTILMLTYSLVLLVIFACLVMALMLAGIYVLKFIL